jgi:hypothetical protein
MPPSLTRRASNSQVVSFYGKRVYVARRKKLVSEGSWECLPRLRFGLPFAVQIRHYRIARFTRR